MTSALVTGGAGFIGSHVVDLLVAEGWDVTIFDDLSTGRPENVNPAATFVAGDIRDLDALTAAVAGHEHVFHLAALHRIQPSFDDPVTHEEVNVTGAIHVLLAAKAAGGVRKVVVSASSACYGTPEQLPTPETAPIDCLSPYALQKYAAEQHALILGERYEVPVVALRYFNAYGPRSFNPENAQNAYSSVVGIFHHQHQTGGPLTVTGTGEQRRDFVHVHDIARANLAAATSERQGVVYNVGAGATVTVLELAQLFGGEVVHIPERRGEAAVTWADTSKIERELGWRPTIDLARGLELLA